MLDFFRAWFYWWTFGFRIGWWKFRYKAVERALILVRQGVYYDLEFAHRIYVGKMGEIYQFANDVAYVFYDKVPTLKGRGRDYFEVYEDERILFMVDGEVVTCPVLGTGSPMDADLLSKFNRGNWGKQLADSIREPSTGIGFGGNLKWILVVIGVALVMFVVYRYVLHGKLPGFPGGNQTLPSPTPGQTPIIHAMNWLMWFAANV